MGSDALVLDIKSPILQRLHRDWEARRRGRRIPARADFDPLDLRYVLGDLSVIDVLRNPLRFRFRLHASNVAAYVGFELTGKNLDTLPDADYAGMVRHHFAAVVEARRPIVLLRDRLMTDQRLWHCEVLVLPLGRDGETVDMLFSAFVRL